MDHSAKISQHDRFTSVWFQFNGFGTIKASSTGYSGRLNNSIARFDRCALRALCAAAAPPLSQVVANFAAVHSAPLGLPTAAPISRRWSAGKPKQSGALAATCRRTCYRSPFKLPAALVQLSHNPSQLCGRRVFYQLLVCDNAIESDIGAPYYSNQQLFPGFMMTEYDGKHAPVARSLVACPSPRHRRRS